MRNEPGYHPPGWNVPCSIPLEAGDISQAQFQLQLLCRVTELSQLSGTVPAQGSPAAARRNISPNPGSERGAQCPRSIAGNCTTPGFAQPMGHRAPLPPRDCGLHALGKFCADQGRQTRGAAAALQSQPLFGVAKLWESVNPSVKQEGRVQRSQRWQCTCSLHNSCKIKCIYLTFFFFSALCPANFLQDRLPKSHCSFTQ